MERDDEAFEDVLDAVSEEIEAVSADGAYDKRKCYEALESQGARANIPPRVDAQYWEKEGEAHARNQNLTRINELGRTQWKQESGYHRRSERGDSDVSRSSQSKAIRVSRRTFDNQATELLLACVALNRMTHLGMPDSYALDS